MAINTPFVYERNCICIDKEITNNAITIDGIDYFVYYLNQNTKIVKVPIPMFLPYIKHRII